MAIDLALATALAASAALLGLFGLHRSWLLVRFRWSKRAELRELEEFPSVTVQVPLYDERAVAARVIRAVGALDYPRERFELQVLDDSKDETREIVEREVAHLRARGIDAHVVRRDSRAGFKAGALDHGLRSARGELIAVFDADFVPAPDFLRELVGAFRDPSIGMVQARWEHLNRDESPLTRAQATLLDSHFVITHKVRFERELFFHFNGTAGVWRRSAIEQAGGWQLDTLTEDLDLSYRAQLAGWRFVYAAHVVAPAELPADIVAFKSQQARWARGTVQVARKLLGRIWRAPLALRVKLEATLHFLSHGGHPLVLAMTLLLPLALSRSALQAQAGWFALLTACAPAVFAFYETAQRAIGRRLRDRVGDAVAALVLGLGMSWTLACAAVRGLASERGEFLRTPKRGATPGVYRGKLCEPAGIELAFALWSAWGLVEALRAGAWGAAVFLVLQVAGFAWVGALSIAHARSAPSEQGERLVCDRASSVSSP